LSDGAPRSSLVRSALGAVLLLLVCVLLALGTWQLFRLSWKLDLIARVEERVHAAPVPAPARPAWPDVHAAADEYRHIAVRGTFLHDREALVQAVTERGGGFWVLTPLRTDAGDIILVNRGFVPPDRRDRAVRAAAQVAGETLVTGLLRITEPGGGFLRSNDPAGDRWYSRDVQAIAAARDLVGVAPYFIDADATPNPGGYPVGGLTVIAFSNHHLVYALTWYSMAGLLAGAGVWSWRQERAGPARRSTAGKTGSP
jgi:surfeit locus 1 family protein